MLLATDRSDTETNREVQVSWGWIRKPRRRTGYLNLQGNCNNESFALFGCFETRIVEKKQNSQFWKKCLSLLTTVSLYGYENLVTIERVRSQMQASKMRFCQKIKGVTFLTRRTSLKIRKSLELLPLQIKISQLRWFGHASRRSEEKLSNKPYLPNQMEKNHWTT